MTLVMYGQTTYTVTNTNDSGAGSLRQAITDANANLGADIINFSIGAGGFQTITPLSALPTISEAVTINATTQTGYAGTPLIEINGTSAGVGTTCFTVTGGNTTIRGFIINRFSGNGITLMTGNGNTVAGNYIGTNSAGTATLGAMAENIQVRSANNTVGGATTVDRNIIAGGADGLRIYGATATGNTIINNYIGTGVNGTEVLGFSDDGLDIGTSAANNTIGGTSADLANIIRNATGDGIEFRSDAGTGNVILGNAIFSNGGNGIDFNQDGITANDAGDGDTGPNGLQNYPVLTSAASGAGGTTIVGTLNSNASTTYRIEFFTNSPLIADANGEGQVYLGFVEVTTNVSGNATINTTLVGVYAGAGDKISATATVKTGGSTYGSTSEYAANVTATSTIAPGGVTTNLGIWLKADAGATTGATFNWADQSGNARNATQGTTANHPTISSNSMNFNPTVTFDGSDDYLNVSNAAGLPTGAAQVHGFSVARNTNVASQYNTIFSYGNSGGGNTVFSLNKYAFNANAYLATNGADVISGAFEFFNNATVLMDGKYTGTQGVLSSFGKQQASTAFVHNLTATVPTVGAWLGGIDAWWNGNIGEIILYSSNLSALDVQKVNSYLALKYGITLDQTTPQSYIASDGTIFWDANTYSVHKYNIAGIVRNDASGLNQKQSKSANSGFQVAIGNGNTIATTNAANTNNFSADKAGMVWGDNAASVVVWTSTGAPASRLVLARRWRLQETGTVGSVKVQVPDNSGVNGLPVENTTVYLLVDADGNFTVGATEIAMTLNGANWEANVDFSNGQFFTFATQSTSVAPGGVTGTAIWLKADAGVTTGATFSWTDQSGNNRNGSQSTAGNQPTYTSNSFNYNPSVTFDGSNDYLALSNLAGLPTGAAQVQEFAVANNTNTAGGWQHILNYGNGVAYQAFGLSKNQLNANAVAMGFYVDAISNALEFIGGQPALLDGKYDGTQLIISSFGTQKVTSPASLNLGTSVGYVGVDPVIANTTHWAGNIQEVVLYSTNLSAIQVQRVNSYLALKYGITLTQTPPLSYVASDGTVFWDANAYSTHKNNIAGIVRDDASGLNQKQSKSVNAGLQVAIGHGNTISATNAANTNNFSADKTAFVWGDNGASVSAWTSAGAPANRVILPRVWKVQKTGTTSLMKFQIPDNSAPNGLPAEGTAVYLLMDADGDFSSGASSAMMSLVGSNWECGANFSSGYYFTFATEQTANAGTFPTVSSCFDVKSAITVTHNNNHNAGNTQRYVLCNAQNIIMQVNTTPTFNTCGIGDFIIYAVNYPTNGVTNLTVGTDITALSGSPTNYALTPLSISVCKTLCGKYTSIVPQ